jgi:YfiH family protein
MEWRESEGIRWLEAELPGARAAFSSRPGGTSEPPYDSLNVGLLTGDDRDRVLRNRRALTEALGLEAEHVLMGLQVHGAEVAVHDRAPERSGWTEPGPNPQEADGHATAEPGLVPLVMVADCLPVALAGPSGVAMIHCGWRGLADGIAERGASAVEAEAAAVGPGIGPCCYEVGDEVAGRFAGLGDGIAKPTGEGKAMLDLREVARRLLSRAGIGEIEVSGLCTSCEAELFYSHRRDGERTGRQAGLAWRQA